MLTTTGSSLRMPVLLAAVLALLCSIPASAQNAPPIQGTTTTTPGLTLAGTVSGMVKPIAAPHTGDALNFDTILEVGTMPLAASSSGFTIKLDPSTGLQVRTATTFGPSFAERALTTGEGGVNVGVSFMNSSLTRLGGQALAGMQVRSVTAPSPLDSRSGTINFTETASTVLIGARMGVNDKLDIGVDLPIVTVKVDGSTSLANGRGDILTYATGGGKAAGLGDIAGLVKYRFHSFGDGQPDPGGLAVMATLRFPTGSTDSLRGLGVTRTLVQFIASGGQARFRPHANIGFEWWSDGVSVVSDATAGGSTVTARNQLQYAAGFEFEAAPKATLLLDVVGGQIFGGGKLAFQADPTPASGATSSSSLVALPEGLARLNLAPGVKVNLKGKMLLSLSALIAMKNDGLHARVTPLAGIDITF
jgi:hypothetical protein